LNSAPHLFDWDQFGKAFRSVRHRELCGRLENTIDQMLQHGIRPRLALVGGSFTNPCAQPRDLDCALFYECGANAIASALPKLAAEATKYDVDMRLIPLDASPALMLK